MILKNIWFIFLGLNLWFISPLLAAAVIHHDMKISILPTKSTITVQDEITLSDTLQTQNQLEFSIHDDLQLQYPPQAVKLGVTKATDKVPLARYRVRLKPGQKKIRIVYSGIINHKIENSENESDRSFSNSLGVISEEGVFLAASTAWYPLLQEKLLSFRMSVTMPPAWISVSQGERSRAGDELIWSETNPQDEIYLVAGKYRFYEQDAGPVKAQVYLRKADDSLAQKYLDVTGQYIEMYSKLLGPYPYKKFALVENFWESGYGMPSFTLLGSKVIRLPFILHSSYPHEILHNWWGNGVYVDYEKGNWVEGLTAYLADHLIKEQRNKGSDYRRNTLQKYTDFVNEARDFALTEFKSRHNASTAAIGYGKTMMLFHMLRLQLGEEKFVNALRTLYKKFRFRPSSYADVEEVFSSTSGVNLRSEFEQWVQRTGAPELKLGKTKRGRIKTGFRTKVEILQVQKGPAYDLRLPVVIYGRGKDQILQRTFRIKSKRQLLSVYSSFEPVRLTLDPRYDMFRRLHNAEIPSALSQGFGAAEVLVLLPAKAPAEQISAYRSMAQSWKKSQEGRWQIKLDSEVKQLPAKGTVWLLGWSNRFRHLIGKQLSPHEVVFKKQEVKKQEVKIQDAVFNSNQHSVLLTARNTRNTQSTLVWLAAGSQKAMPGLTRKLPHYSKYSYLVFKGEEPQNILKGQWPVLNSPMTVSWSKKSAHSGYAKRLSPSQALAQLPPLFSAPRMLQMVELLASDKMQGRGLGSPQLDEAAEYIAARFKQAGLQAGGAEGSYYQNWVQDVGDGKGKMRLRNVVGVLPGHNPKLKKQSLVVGAHYDHLGRGWPDVHQGDEGKVHYGADDNASGVAVMLEFIKNVAPVWKPERTIVFVAFTAEEAGRLGSLYYVNADKPYPTENINAMINLDTVGRLGQQPLTVFGTGSATQWVHIFRGVGFVTGLKVKSVAGDFGSSDQKSFLDNGVPAVQFFGGIHQDFHRPSDTIEKLDGNGMVKITTILKETVDYLANRLEPLTITLEGIAGNSGNGSGIGTTAQKTSGRKVSLGTVPDFAYTGSGVRITQVLPGSPAEISGLRAEDIIVNINGESIVDLRAYAAFLRRSKAGDALEIGVIRDGSNKKIQAVLKAR